MKRVVVTSIAMLMMVSTVLQLGLAAEATTQWRLVWADEFDQPDGSAPDPTKWVFDIGGGVWGNNELEYYTDRRTNARIEGGKLIIEARKETSTASRGKKYSYTSARLKTQGKASWTFGRIEARIKLPIGQGIWPAFWMLGTNITKVDWPACGEIDIMENIGREAFTVHGTIHGPGYSGPGGIGGECTVSNGVALAKEFHLLSIEWEPEQIRWFLDQKPYFTVSPASLPAGKKWVFDHDHFILLNVAVGGGWPGNPNSTTSFPQRMEVDYVRVYARTNAAGQKSSQSL